MIVSDFHLEAHYDADVLASKIAKRTYKHSLDREYRSPFSIEAQKAGLKYKGGKPDDITVVIGKVRLSPEGRDLTGHRQQLEDVTSAPTPADK